jgi:hypothetical protein
MVEEVKEPKLGEGLPEEKLQEPYCNGKMSRMVEDVEHGALAALI